jgi:hypothetical protein
VRKNDLRHTGDLLEIWKGGTLIYGENKLDAIKEALFKFQQKNDTKASPAVIMTYSSGQVCAVIEISPLILSDNIYSYRLLSLYSMTRRLLREYSTISWRYLLSEEM